MRTEWTPEQVSPQEPLLVRPERPTLLVRLMLGKELAEQLSAVKSTREWREDFDRR